MGLTIEQSMEWSRYGMDPFNWVVDRKVLASVYPRNLDYLKYLRNVEGVQVAVNLSEYPWPAEWPSEVGISCHHFPIKDMNVPSPMQVSEIIGIMDSSDDPVMVHCAAGIGRTGTMIALYMVDHGMKPDRAIDHVRRKRPGSIQTSEQERIIFEWAEMRSRSDDS